MGKYENDLINSYHETRGVKPLVWYRYIDDIFFIWTEGPEKLSDFLEYAQNFSKMRKMKSNIRFEVNQSVEKVNFLDVEVCFSGTTLTTSLYSKPTDAHMYLNTTSNHPKHVVRNIPKGQFIRIRRICSNVEDFKYHAGTLSRFLVKRGYNPKSLTEIACEVSKMDRSELLLDKKLPKKDPQTIFVADWHPSLATLPSILKNHLHLIKSDSTLEKLFQIQPSVAFRKPKSLRNQLIRSDILAPTKDSQECTINCGKNCMICKSLASSTTIKNNKKKNAKSKIRDFGTCQSRNLVYAVRCKKCDVLYVGQTGETLQKRMSKHRYDCKKRPSNCELAQHFHQNHDLENDMEIHILQTGLKTEAEREFHEDRWICRLQTLQPHGINKDLNQFASDMYVCFSGSL